MSASENAAVSGEGVCDAALFAFTLVALSFVAAEYAAEHLGWPWGHARKHLFAIGVIAGFAGELVFEMGSFGYSYRLQSLQAAHIGELEASAGEAKTSAEKAVTDAATAEAAARNAQYEVSGLSDRAAAIRKELAAEEKKLASVKAPLVERHLTPAQVRALAASLRGKQVRVALFAPGPDREVNIFAKELLDALNRAGVVIVVRVSGEERENGTDIVPNGTNISGDKGPSRAALESAFRAARIPFGNEPMTQQMIAVPGAALLTIGVRGLRD